jgi:adenylate cyclase
MWSQLGEPERAFELLEDWVERVGPDLKSWFEHDADLEPLRDHPRYRKLLVSIRA